MDTQDVQAQMQREGGNTPVIEGALPHATHLPPAGAVGLAMAVGGYIFYDTGVSIMELGRKYPDFIERNTLLIHDTAPFMHEEGKPGWRVVGWKRELEARTRADILPLTARELVHACVVRSAFVPRRLIWLMPTATIHSTQGSHIHLGEWRVYLRQSPGSCRIRVELRHPDRKPHLPFFAGVHVS
jgi:hypothetical protein